jgi:hypothetical protein
MPNWAEGTLKLRGRRKNIKSALKEMFIGSDVSISEEMDDQALILTLTSINSYFYINNTKRAFIDKNKIEVLLEEDFEIIEIDDFKQAWRVIPKNYQEFSKKYNVDIKIFVFEQGLQFTQEIEIVDGQITKNETRKYDDYQWDVPFSKLGG